MQFEQIPNYSELCSDITTDDAYKLKSLILLPDVVFDIGANIGVFTHYARKLFPDALIVAVEPHPENFAVLQKYAPAGNTILLNKGIGSGQMWRYPDVGETGAGESYVSSDFGYRLPNIEGHPLEKTYTQPVLLDELYEKYVLPGQRLAIKLDCEGAENLLFAHPPSVEVLQKADFVTMELHPYWGHCDNETLASRVRSILGDTHRCDSEIPYFHAWRKPDGEPIAGRQEFGKLLAERGLLGNAAEIGVCTGVYSRDILDWGVKHLLLVDPWRELPSAPCGISDEQHEKYYQECLANIQGCGDRVTILRMLSVEAARKTPDESLDWVYVDANHRYEGISVDLRMWWPKVRSGGILSGHDYLTPSLGVNRAVTEFAAERGLHVHLVIEHQEDSSFWITKP